MTVNDWRGAPIEPGCTIVYPGRQGSSLWMTEAKVLSVREVPIEYGYRKGQVVHQIDAQPLRRSGWRSNDGLKRIVITSVDRVTVIE